MALLSSDALGGSSTRRVGAPTEEVPMALTEYDVEINGVQTTVQLSDEDAEARGLTKPEPKKATARNKAKTPANKAAG